MFPETFGNNSVKAGVLLGEIHQQIKPTLVSFGILRGVDPVIQRQPRGIHVLLAAMLLLQHVVQSARQPKPQTPDVPAWFICVRSYVCVHIWASIYGHPYMDIHIWAGVICCVHDTHMQAGTDMQAGTNMESLQSNLSVFFIVPSLLNTMCPNPNRSTYFKKNPCANTRNPSWTSVVPSK